MIQFMRHAQSRFNTGINEIDSGLSEHGKQQASKISGNVSLVIVSTLKRTQETLQYSKLKYNELMVSDLCREHKNSVNSLCDYLESEKNSRTLETHDDLETRIAKFKDLLDTQSKIHNSILVISHGYFMSTLLQIPCVGNCAIVKYVIAAKP